MPKYLTYAGTHLTYPLSIGRTGFLVQSATLENFNDSMVIANAAYFKDAPIWGHKELHLTKAWVIYVFSAANTKVSLLAATGPNPTAYVAVPLIDSELSTAAGQKMIESELEDIPLEPTGESNNTSAVQFILIPIVGNNAADDVTLVFQGWYRDEIPEIPASESVPDSERGLLEQLLDLLG